MLLHIQVLSDVEYSVNFNADSSSVVSTSNYTIGFSTFHKFRDNEKVVYKTDKQKQSQDCLQMLSIMHLLLMG